MLLTLTVASGAILPVDVRRPFRPATVYVDDIAHWHGPPSGAVAPDGGASTDDGSCGSDSTSGPLPLMDASDTSSDDDSDDSSGWDSLFSGCTDVSPDGPGLCGRPFGHSSRQPPVLIDVSVRPARSKGAPAHGMRHGAEANPYRAIPSGPMSSGAGDSRTGPVRVRRGAAPTRGLHHAADALLQETVA